MAQGHVAVIRELNLSDFCEMGSVQPVNHLPRYGKASSLCENIFLFSMIPACTSGPLYHRVWLNV